MATEFERGKMLRAYFVFSGLLLIILVRFFNHTLVSQMSSPPFLNHEKEWVYHFVFLSGIAQTITGNYFIAFIFDICLFLFPVLFLATRKTIFAFLTTLSLVICFFIFNMVTGHHYHGLVGAMVISVPFWFKEQKRFLLVWEGARYYFLYIFTSAALWKIFRGSVFSEEQLSNILRMQQIDLLLQHPDSFQSEVVRFLIAHARIAHGVLIINVIIQLSFLIGFFSKKFDNLLIALAILFCLANYFVMSILSAELLVLGFALADWKKIGSYFRE